MATRQSEKTQRIQISRTRIASFKIERSNPFDYYNFNSK